MKNRLSIRSEEGAAAVEFAILLPVFTLIILGIVYFGFLFNAYISITHAAKEGARWAALRSTSAEIDAHIKSALPEYIWPGAVFVIPDDVPYTQEDQGGDATVTVRYSLPAGVADLIAPINGIGEILGGGVRLPDSISAQATQRIE